MTKEEIQKELEELNLTKMKLESQLYSIHLRMSALIDILKREEQKEEKKKKK